MYQVSKSKRRFFPSNLWNINMRVELLDYEQFFCLFTSLKIPFPNSKQKYKYYIFIVWIKGAVCDVAKMRRSFVFLSFQLCIVYQKLEKTFRVDYNWKKSNMYFLLHFGIITIRISYMRIVLLDIAVFTSQIVHSNLSFSHTQKTCNF